MKTIFALLSALFAAGVAPAQPAGLRVYISVDAAGGGGVTNFEDLDSRDADYNLFRRILTSELNAAVEGALRAGATEIVVEEQHGRSLLVDDLNPKIRLFRGWPRPRGGATGLTADFQAAIFLGYHAREGTPNAVLAHTFLPDAVADFRINGRSFGEAEYYAILAGSLGVPVVMVTGDDLMVKQIKEFLGPIEAVSVKQSLSPTCAIVEPPSVIEGRIRIAAEKAVHRRAEFRAVRLSPPYQAEFVLKPAWDSSITKIVKQNPDISQPSPRTLAKTCKTIDELIDFEVKMGLRLVPSPYSAAGAGGQEGRE